MPLKMESDLNRFRKIVRGKIKKELRRFISNGDLIGRQGKKLVTIPLPRIDIPHFQFGSEQQGGVGQGKGEVGDSVGQGKPEDGDGQGEAGDGEGQHTLEVDVSLEELAQILGEELELPNIEPKGDESIQDRRDRYTGIRPIGPESLRHFRRTFRRAMRRQITAGSYDPENPVIVPIRTAIRPVRTQTDSTPGAAIPREDSGTAPYRPSPSCRHPRSETRRGSNRGRCTPRG